MKLSLNKEYQSITAFVAEDLPDFTIITGPNGSGKTHLLKAIEIGSVLIDGVAMNAGVKAKFFDANSIVPKSTGAFATTTLEKLHKAELLKLTRFQENIRASLRTHLRSQLQVLKQVVPNFQLTDPFDLLNTDLNSNGLYTEQQQIHLNALKTQANAYVIESTSAERLRSSKIATGLSAFALEKNISILQLSKEDLESAAIGVWGDVNAFQQNLGQLFVAYRDLWVKNEFKKITKQRSPDKDIRILSDKDFVEKYGQSPWEFVNEILVKAKLPFSINSPELDSYADFTPQLTKTKSEVKIPFESLSAGEKVLMSFALCLYQVQDGRQAIEYPEILLFDEIDAPLHPSMVKDLISTINEILVAEKKVKVILTTHSPTTVALAPEKSVFVMHDSSTLKKTSKEDALRLLTYGVPTLSISFDARRQVFVESRKDAYLYDELYKVLKPKIASEKSLVFIAASGAEKQTDVSSENGGSTVVAKLVNQLASAGNTSVYGVVDWDTKRTTTDRVKVIAEKRRYSLDSCVLDPCLLVLLIARENIGEAKKLNLLSSEETYFSLSQTGKERMQVLVDKLSALLNYVGERDECHYSGGESLQLMKSLLHDNGHSYSKRVIEVFPFLRQLGNNKNIETEIMNQIVRKVAPEFSGWLPIELQEMFEELVK